MKKVNRMRRYVRRAGDLRHQVQDRARDAGDWLEQVIDEYPLAVGAAFFTMGLVGGLAIPASRSEDRLFGRACDRLMNQVHELGSHIVDKGHDAAQRAMAAIRQTVDENLNPAS